jgi:hypothetical protein
MPAAPVWGTASSAFVWENFNDFSWIIQGFHIRGNDVNGCVNLSSDSLLKDCILESDTTTRSTCIRVAQVAVVEKCRTIEGDRAFEMFGDLTARNCLTDGNATVEDVDMSAARGRFFECEFGGNVEFSGGANNAFSTGIFSNCIFNTIDGTPGSMEPFSGSSDHDGTPGNSVGWRRQAQSGTTTADFITEETTTVRSGGSNTSLSITPGSTAQIGDNPLGRVKLLEHSFYATTTSKQYDLYMRPTATTAWTTDPTASELWIELEAWGHASNNFRKITKSTGVIDMNGSTSWQALSVTVAPAQAGVAFFRLWYAKPKEAQANTFYVDPIPVVT